MAAMRSTFLTGSGSSGTVCSGGAARNEPQLGRQRSATVQVAARALDVATTTTPTTTTSVRTATRIESVTARQVIDSRGNPTVEVDLVAGGNVFRSAVPSGASTGIYEALELRDGDGMAFGGKGVLQAVRNINDVLGKKLLGLDARY
jgi:hypothetical protein